MMTNRTQLQQASSACLAMMKQDATRLCNKIVEALGSQTRAAQLLGITTEDVANILNGRINNLTTFVKLLVANDLALNVVDAPAMPAHGCGHMPMRPMPFPCDQFIPPFAPDREVPNMEEENVTPMEEETPSKPFDEMSRKELVAEIKRLGLEAGIDLVNSTRGEMISFLETEEGNEMEEDTVADEPMKKQAFLSPNQKSKILGKISRELDSNQEIANLLAQLLK